MTPDELDGAYTQLCEAMGRVGQAQAPLFLAMVSLALIARQADPAEALAVIEQAESALAEPAPSEAAAGDETRALPSR